MSSYLQQKETDIEDYLFNKRLDYNEEQGKEEIKELTAWMQLAKGYENIPANFLRDFLTEKLEMKTRSIEDVERRLADEYGQIGSRDEWNKWLTKGLDNSNRFKAFQIAIIFHMDEKELLWFLNMIDGESIRLRDPKEIIYFYSLRREYDLNHADHLYWDIYKPYADGYEYTAGTGVTIEYGNTYSIDFSVFNQIGDDTADAMLISKLQEDIEQINSIADSFSVSKAAKYVRLLQYLWVIYSSKETDEKDIPCFKIQKAFIPADYRNNKAIIGNSKEKSCPVSFLPKCKPLYSYMNFWAPDYKNRQKMKFMPNELTQYPAGEQIISYCERENVDVVKVVETIKCIGNQFIKFSDQFSDKYYVLYGINPYERGVKYKKATCTENRQGTSKKEVSKIVNAFKDGKKSYARVQRSEVLQLIYYLIVGIGEDKEIELSDLPRVKETDPVSENIDTISSPGEIWSVFDNKFIKLQEKIRKLNIKRNELFESSKEKAEDIRKHQNARPDYQEGGPDITIDYLRAGYTGIFNEILKIFGFEGIYLKNIYDRFYMMLLISQEQDELWGIFNNAKGLLMMQSEDENEK